MLLQPWQVQLSSQTEVIKLSNEKVIKTTSSFPMLACRNTCFLNSIRKKVSIFTFRSTLRRWKNDQVNYCFSRLFCRETFWCKTIQLFWALWKRGSILPLLNEKKGQKCGLQDFWSNIVTMSDPATCYSLFLLFFFFFVKLVMLYSSALVYGRDLQKGRNKQTQEINYSNHERSTNCSAFRIQCSYTKSRK